MLEMRPLPLREILDRLLSAQRVVSEGILDPSLPVIPYRRGSRDYGPDEHLEVVTAHIQSHMIRVLEAQRGSSVGE